MDSMIITYRLGVSRLQSAKFYIVKKRRTEYGKKIRKDYEAGRVKEKIGNMREPIAVRAEFANTLTTVQKDNLIVVVRCI